ncbi:MAG TPA: hypothetical protein VE007_06945 [Thermoanaerobaculia bacterium]|nr:hypothetical protein [Thermoanaerobaculia bacterium]
MSRWTRVLSLSLLPVAAAVALGSAPIQESAPVHKKKSNPSAEHGATTKPAPGADASLNPQPIPPGRNKSVVPGIGRKNGSKKSVATDGSNSELRDTSSTSARRKSARTTDGSNSELRDTSSTSARRKSARTTDGSSSELRDTSSTSARRKSSVSKSSSGELRDPSSRKTSKTKLNTDGEIRHPSSKKSSTTSSKTDGTDKGIIFVGGKKTQKTQKTRS